MRPSSECAVGALCGADESTAGSTPLLYRMGAVTLCALVALIGCRPAQTTEAQEIRLAQKKIYERCFNLTPGARVDYRFEASAPVAFNIHYHRGEAVVYGLDEVTTRHADDSFHPETGARYCVMWTNPNLRAADVSYAFTIVRH